MLPLKEYIIFGFILALSLLIDLFVLAKPNKELTIKKSLRLTLFWVAVSITYMFYVWLHFNRTEAIVYLTAYLTEWSLSIDNVFVFVIIFESFKVKLQYESKVLILGVLFAILFRIIFIFIGVNLISQFAWILYIFGVFLIYSGWKMIKGDEESKMQPHESKIFKFLQKYLPLDPDDANGKIIYRSPQKKIRFSILFAVVAMLGLIDIVFALDSIPAVLGISTNPLIVFSSNIFAILGLRSLYFLIKNAADKFDYLPVGIGLILLFIGCKMIVVDYLEKFISKDTLTVFSFLFIILCINGSIFYSLFINRFKK